MEKIFKVFITTQKGTKEVLCDHVYDVENLIDALVQGESVTVMPLFVIDVTKENADSILHGDND